MSQYIPQNPQRFYPQTYDYASSQSNYLIQHSNLSPMIRQSSLNRNHSISSSMTLKPGKIQENICGKIKRQNTNMRNSQEFKENDPYTKNSILNSNLNKLTGNLRDSTDVVSEYDPKYSYNNQFSTKRERNSHEFSRQKLISNQSKNQDNYFEIHSKNAQNNGKDNLNQQKMQKLNERMSVLQTLMKNNGDVLTLHSNKLQKLEQICSQTSFEGQQKHETNQQSLTKSRHARSITGNISAGPSFKQLSDIMTLIEESKNYQIKNAEQYRKMIAQFRSTLLDFREELNKTAKKTEIQSQLIRLRQLVGSVNNSKVILNNKNTQLLRNSSHTDINSTKNGLSRSPSNKSNYEEETLQKLQSDILALKVNVQKLDENSMSLKADMVKANVREKKFCEEVQSSFGEVNKKLIGLQKQILPFYQTKKGNKYEGIGICFKVIQQVVSCMIPKPPSLSRSSQMVSTSVENSKQSQVGISDSLRNSHEKSSSVTSSSSSSSSTENLSLSSKTYYIDKQGYLLDQDNYYLLNERNEQIKLSQKQISLLKKMGILE